jgi:uncharacterized protein (TIGR02284 family)
MYILLHAQLCALCNGMIFSMQPDKTTHMETTNEKVIEQLNNLVEINNDRIRGYETALKETATEDADLRKLFEEMAEHSRQFKNELSFEVKRLGGTPSEGTKNSGKVFRAWMDFKAALTGKNRKEIISSCEFGEDAALETYKDVINSDVVFPENIREIILKEKQWLQQDHNKVRELRDAEKNKTSDKTTTSSEEKTTTTTNENKTKL